MSDKIEFEVQEEEECGLRLPDGTEIWPPNTWHGCGVDTVPEREAIQSALHQSVENLGMPKEDFLSQYRWLKRVNKRYITLVPGQPVSYPITESPVTQPENEAAEELSLPVAEHDATINGAF